MNNFDKGVNDADLNKPAAPVHNIPWQAANRYNTGYTSNN